jgi:HD-GYP domain-containing protein (c-di-GMP phosphodiesterase class II)
MFVSETTPGLTSTGLNSRGLISKPETLHKLTSSGIVEIHIDTSKGKASEHSVPVSVWNADVEPTVALDEERERAEKVYGEARSLVDNIIGDVKLGKAIDTAPVQELAEEIGESLYANANALLCLSQIREKDEYLLEHSINVGVLMGIFARYLGYQKEQLTQMVTGAVLHDIGKIRVPSEILNKAGKLEPAEWREMQNHVLYGEEVLVKSHGVSDIALKICAQHHEKLSGTGYPRGLKGKQVSIYGRMASIVDIYDAITADRCYHNGRSPFDSMRILTDLGKEEALDKSLVYQFIRCMGVYPVGTLVELSNKKLAVVQQVNLKKPNFPVVKIFYDQKSRSYEKSLPVDLAESNSGVSVIKARAPESIKIKVKDLI